MNSTTDAPDHTEDSDGNPVSPSVRPKTTRGSSLGRIVLRVVGAAAVAVVVVVATLVWVGRAQAVDLPPERPDTLLASVINALRGEPSFAASARASVDLGLPELPRKMAPQGDPISGEHKFRIVRSPDGVRAAELLEDGERAVVMNEAAHEAWTWDSRAFKATHYVARDDPSAGAGAPGDVGTARHGGRHDGAAKRELTDPLELARRTLADVTETTEVSVRPPVRIAGRDCYVLAIVPKTDATLVGSVEIGVDADSRLPLQVEVYGRGQTKPAISAGFTSIDFKSVDASEFTFTPPAGAEVVEASDSREKAGAHETHGAPNRPDETNADVRSFGEGWTTVTAIRVTPPKGKRSQREFDGLFPYSGPLFTAIKVEVRGESWVVIGAVRQPALEGAAAQL